MKKKVISFSLWGDNPIYCQGAIANAELAKLFFPDWEVVMTIGKSVPSTTRKMLESLDVLVVESDEKEDYTGMFWRFASSIMYQDYDYFLSRDCDSRLSEVEAKEVNDWIDSGKKFHSILAHPYHNIPILGGLWGVKTSEEFTKLMLDSSNDFNMEDRYQIDQDFLMKKIFPSVKDDIYYSNMMLKEQKPDFSFIGEAYDEFDKPLIAKNRDILKNYYELLKKSYSNG